MAKKKITKLTELKPDPSNFNLHTSFGMSLLEKSMRKYGFLEAGIISSDGVIASGNARQETAINIGLEEVEVIPIDGKKAHYLQVPYKSDSKEFKEIALILNQVAAKNIVMDAELIEAELGEAVCEEWGIDLPENEVTEDGFDAEPPLKPITVLGDLYELNQHRVLCGDSTDSDSVAKLMNGKKADLCFTDPPYGVDYSGGIQFKNGKAKTEQRERLKNDESDSIYAKVIPIISANLNGACYLWFADTKAKNVYASIENFGEIHALIIWVKNGGFGALNANYKQKHEPCLYWKPRGQKLNFTGASTETTVWNIDKDGQNKLHPTQKPIALAAKAIGNHSAGLILDLFGGSGSTLMGAEQLNRLAYLMELDPAYCDIILARWLRFKQSQSAETAISIRRNGNLNPQKRQGAFSKGYSKVFGAN